MQDRRVRKTQKAIQIAFSELIRKMPIEQISVKELCIIADISKSTFYLHYTDIYNCAESYIDLIVKKVGEILDEYELKSLINNIPDIFYRISTMFNEENNYYYSFLKSPSFRKYAQQKNLKIIDQILIKGESLGFKRDEYVIPITFVVSGLWGILEANNFNVIEKEKLMLLSEYLKTGFTCFHQK